MSDTGYFLRVCRCLREDAKAHNLSEFQIAFSILSLYYFEGWRFADIYRKDFLRKE